MNDEPRAWEDLPGETRREVVALARQGRPHPDPDVSWTALTWARARRESRSPIRERVPLAIAVLVLPGGFGALHRLTPYLVPIWTGLLAVVALAAAVRIGRTSGPPDPDLPYRAAAGSPSLRLADWLFLGAGLFLAYWAVAPAGSAAGFALLTGGQRSIRWKLSHGEDTVLRRSDLPPWRRQSAVRRARRRGGAVTIPCEWLRDPPEDLVVAVRYHLRRARAGAGLESP